MITEQFHMITENDTIKEEYDNTRLSATVPLGTSAFVDPLPFCLPCPPVICLLSFSLSSGLLLLAS